MRSLPDLLKEMNGLLPPDITAGLQASPRQVQTTDKEQVICSPNEGARIIQRAWRGFIFKQKLFKNFYKGYMELYSLSDKDVLAKAEIIFGQSIARIMPGSEYSFNHPEEGNFYHRDADDYLDTVARQVFTEHNLADHSILSRKDLVFIPTTKLRNADTKKILDQFLPHLQEKYTIFKGSHLSIEILVVYKDWSTEIKGVIKSFGLVASLWELAENKKSPMSIKPPCVQTARGSPGEAAVDKIGAIDEPILPKKHSLDNYPLPTTIQELKTSRIYKKLLITSGRERCPTNKLSECLCKLISKYDGELDKDAIKRIALMADLANTFYVYNYPRYALCVYAIIHEISLSLSKKHPTQPIAEHKEEACASAAEKPRLSPVSNSFDGFMAESKETLSTMLGVTNETEITFVASPATSGTNAYFLAQDLAHKMRIATGEKAQVFIVKPSYYEFDRVSKTTRAADDTREEVTTDNADIFMVSAGPIFSRDGLYPGTDINLFVKNKIINSLVKKHRTIIIDATTALYKNIKLDREVLQLVESGMLSIIIHESHQKFGLIHSDQAQYGRMLCFVSKSYSNISVLETFLKQAKQDFNEHTDMRIGAFISQACGPTLEEIKKQHFSNGGLITQVLEKAFMSHITDAIKSLPDMLENRSELYFVPLPSRRTSSEQCVKEIRELLGKRDSFGHFISTLTPFSSVGARLSPDAQPRQILRGINHPF
jgi:hypothetical protein